MKKRIFFCLIIFPFLVAAQTKHKAEKEFLHSLNMVLDKSDQIYWAYKGKMSVDTSFYINHAGMLSVTVTYKTDSDTYKVRMVAPGNKILYKMNTSFWFTRKTMFLSLKRTKPANGSRLMNKIFFTLAT